MAGEIEFTDATGNTDYANVLNAVGDWYNTGTLAFEAFNAANWSGYKVAATEFGTSSVYRAAMPAVAAGLYNVVARRQAGGSPAQSDQVVGQGSLGWNGSESVGAGNVNLRTVAESAAAANGLGSAGADYDNSGYLSASVVAGGITNASLAADTGLKPLRTGTAQSGTLSTIRLDAGASATNNFYQSCLVEIVAGTGAGQGGRVGMAYLGATKDLSISPAWAVQPDGTSVFVLRSGGSTSVTAFDFDHAPVDNLVSVVTDYALGAWNATIKLAAVQPNYAPSKAGDAMTLTSGERTAVASAWGTSVVGNGRTRDYFLQGGFNKTTRTLNTLTVYSWDDTTILKQATLSQDGTLLPISSVV